VTQTEVELEEVVEGEATPPDAWDKRTAPVFVIRPARRWPHLDVSELWHYRELLGRFVWRDVKVRYKQTFIGIAWAFLVPALTAAVYVVIFGKFANFPSGNVAYPSMVIAAVLPMQYFSSAVTGSSMSLVANLPLVTKVYFPRVLLPLGSALVPAVDFLVGLPALLVLMAYYGTWPTGPQVLTAPIFLGLAFVTALGIGLALAAMNARYRDVPFMIPPFLQLMPFLSAVPFAVQEIPEKWQWILAFNPMTAVITGWRWAVLGAPAPDFRQTALGATVGILLFVGGLSLFRSTEPRIADTI